MIADGEVPKSLQQLEKDTLHPDHYGCEASQLILTTFVEDMV